MYLGQIVEVGPTVEVISNPKHPYTKALLAAIPSPGTAPVRLPGEPASPLAVPSGCSFHPRCPERIDECATEAPILYSLDGTSSRLAACLLTDMDRDRPERAAS
jgi:peptide/nickel transport system ATP-binding protein